MPWVFASGSPRPRFYRRRAQTGPYLTAERITFLVRFDARRRDGTNGYPKFHDTAALNTRGFTILSEHRDKGGKTAATDGPSRLAHGSAWICTKKPLQRLCRLAEPAVALDLLLILESLLDEAGGRSSSLWLVASFSLSCSSSAFFQSGNFLREALLPYSAYSARVTTCWVKSGLLANANADL
jgi:hypothetical protein